MSVTGHVELGCQQIVGLVRIMGVEGKEGGKKAKYETPMSIEGKREEERDVQLWATVQMTVFLSSRRTHSTVYCRRWHHLTLHSPVIIHTQQYETLAQNTMFVCWASGVYVRTVRRSLIP